MAETTEKPECSAIKIEDEVILSILTSNVKSYIQEIKLRNHHKPKRKKFCFLCRSQTTSLLLILGTYVTIFSVASILLIMSVLRLQNLNESDKFTASVKNSDDVYRAKYNSVLKQTDNSLSGLFKEFMWPFKSSAFNCSSLSDIKKFNYLTSGWTKNVFSFEHSDKKYALKTINIDGVDMKKCMEIQSTKLCLEKASSKMYKEYILSRELAHTNIIQVLAWCVSGNNLSNDVAVITELCSPIDVISLLRMSFSQRLKIMLDLSQLMAYLADSPLGSVAINDYQRQQFVMCGNTLKLTDLDDLSIEEPKCNEHVNCSQEKLIQYLSPSDNHINEFQFDCINNHCFGYNEKQNVINTYRHFVNLFLNITTPAWLKKDVESLFNSYTSSWNAKTVLMQTELLYISGNGAFKTIFPFVRPYPLTSSFEIDLFETIILLVCLAFFPVFIFFKFYEMAGIVNFAADLVKQARPKLATFWYFAKVELVPPKPSEVPEIMKGFGRLIEGYKNGTWKQVTVKEGFLNMLVTAEVFCWFYIGECIGKRHIVGYKID